MSEQATETGPLTVDAAIASLIPAETEDTAPEAPVEAAEEPTEPEGETSTPEEPEAEPEEPAEGEEGAETAEAETLPDAPLYWSPEGKAKWASLSPELQAEILAQEGPRETATAKAKAEAAAERQAANKELQGVKALAEHLSSFLPQAIEAFQNQWGTEEPDWEATIEAYGAEETAKLQARFHKQRNLLAQTYQAQQATAAEARKAELAEELAALNEADPDLAPDPKDFTKGSEKRAEVSNYLKANGIAESAVHLISAAEMVIAKKAMLWDRTQAALKAAPPKKPAAPAPKAPVRPAASASAPNPSKQAANRFAQTRSVDDAVALLLAPKG